jgi:hypothetical protein
MSPWVVLGFVLAVSSSYMAGHWRGDSQGQATVRAQWNQERAQLAAEHAENQRIAREKERAMQVSADKLREEKDREIRDLNARAASLTDSLRKRPERAASGSAVPGATGLGPTSTSCTGAGLSREDAQFLAGEATRADELRAAFKQCLAQYEAVRSGK